MNQGQRRIAILAMDGMWVHDVANIVQVFGIPADESEEEPYRIDFYSYAERVSFDHGMSVQTVPFCDFSRDELPLFVFVPGFSYPDGVTTMLTMDKDAKVWKTMESWIRALHDKGVSIGAIGSGPLLLARMGLLNQTCFTAHWRYADEVNEFCAGARPMLTQMVVHDEEHEIWTCAGGVSGLDMCLSMLIETTGVAHARRSTVNANIWIPRSLETRQDSLGFPEKQLDFETGQEIQDLTVQVIQSLDAEWTIAAMAHQAGMSPRTFQRQFQRVMGEAPSRWLLSERLAVACDLLEGSELTVAAVASQVGLGDADTLRKHFAATYGMTPMAYRRAYRNF